MLLIPVRSRTTVAVICLGLLAAFSGQAFAQATAASNFSLLPGFKVELLHTVPAKTQGSWVSLAIDPKGRLMTSDQYGKLYRVTRAKVTLGTHPGSLEDAATGSSDSLRHGYRE